MADGYRIQKTQKPLTVWHCEHGTGRETITIFTSGCDLAEMIEERLAKNHGWDSFVLGEGECGVSAHVEEATWLAVLNRAYRPPVPVGGWGHSYQRSLVRNLISSCRVSDTVTLSREEAEKLIVERYGNLDGKIYTLSCCGNSAIFTSLIALSLKMMEYAL